MKNTTSKKSRVSGLYPDNTRGYAEIKVQLVKIINDTEEQLHGLGLGQEPEIRKMTELKVKLEDFRLILNQIDNHYRQMSGQDPASDGKVTLGDMEEFATEQEALQKAYENLLGTLPKELKAKIISYIGEMRRFYQEKIREAEQQDVKMREEYCRATTRK